VLDDGGWVVDALRGLAERLADGLSLGATSERQGQLGNVLASSNTTSFTVRKDQQKVTCSMFFL
jgi:hypothetical protein